MLDPSRKRRRSSRAEDTDKRLRPGLDSFSDFIDPPRVDAKFTPTKEQREIVMQMAGLGFAQEDIRLMIENPRTGKCVSENTLRRNFGRELASGSTVAIHLVARALFKEAIGGNVTAMIFFLKTRARWKEDRDPTPGEATPVKIVFKTIDARERKDDDMLTGDHKRDATAAAAAANGGAA